MQLNEIQNKLEENETHAMRITHLESGVQVERPGYTSGDKTRYLIHASDIPDSDSVSFIKENAKQLGSGTYQVEIRRRNGSTYVACKPPFIKKLPIQIQQQGDTFNQVQQPMNNHNTGYFGLSQPEVLRMYHTQQDYNRLVEEKESLKSRLDKSEGENHQLKMQLLEVKSKIDTMELRHDLKIQQRDLKLENEKAEWIRSQKKFTDGLDISKIMESPNLPKILGMLKPGAEQPQVAGLAAPQEQLSRAQTMFITVVKQMNDDTIKNLYLTHHLKSTNNSFKDELAALINKYNQPQNHGKKN